MQAEQTVDFRAEEKEPESHQTQASDPLDPRAVEYLPASQERQDEALSAVEYVPAKQATQKADEVAD
jgi:hypothetical protein